MTAEQVAQFLNKVHADAPSVSAALLAVKVPVSAADGAALDESVLLNEAGHFTVMSLLNSLLRPSGVLVHARYDDSNALVDFGTVPVDQVEFFN